MADYANVGPGVAQFDGKYYKWQEPSPEGFTMTAAYIVKHAKQESAVDRIMPQVELLASKGLMELADKAMARAQAADDETAARTRFMPATLGGEAIYQPDCCAFFLHVLMAPHNLQTTFEDCLAIVEKESAVMVLAKIWLALPGLKEKKDLAPPASSTDGATGDTAATSPGPESSAK